MKGILYGLIVQKHIRKACLLLLLMPMTGFLPVNYCAAQETSAATDTSQVKKHNPKLATRYSMVVPGLGQIYNQKYWKVPLIYGLGGAMIYFINYNQTKYVKFKDAINLEPKQEYYIIDGRTYKYDDLTYGRDYYRRYRDLSVFGLAGVYFLNIVDAMVDAYFINFDVSDDLSMKIRPSVVNNFDLTASVGIKFQFSF